MANMKKTIKPAPKKAVENRQKVKGASPNAKGKIMVKPQSKLRPKKADKPNLVEIKSMPTKKPNLVEIKDMPTKKPNLVEIKDMPTKKPNLVEIKDANPKPDKNKLVNIKTDMRPIAKKVKAAAPKKTKTTATTRKRTTR